MKSSRSAAMVLVAIITIAAGLLFGGTPAFGAAFDDPPKPPPQEEPAAAAAGKDEAKEPEADKEEKPEARPKYLLVKGGDVFTMAGAVLRNTDVLVKDGVIAAIGRGLAAPEEAELLDVTGYRVYPGLIAVSSSRIVGDEPPEDTTDVYGFGMVLGLSGGLTTVVTGNTAAKLTYGSLENMVVKRGIFTTLSFSRGSPRQRQELRDDLEKVRQYLREAAAYERRKAEGDKDAAEPDKKWIKGKYETYLKLLKGEVTALIQADLTQDLRDAADLAQHFGFRLVIRGGAEAWTIAPELGRKGVSLIITPRRKITSGSPYEEELAEVAEGGGRHVPPEGEEGDHENADHSWEDKRLLRPTGWSIKLARALYEGGAPFCIIPEGTTIDLDGITGRDIHTMPMEAAFAVRGGLPDAAAVEAITLGAARILGIDDRTGSIEAGKDADLIVVDGDLLHYKTLVQWTIVNGRVVYDKEKESLFAHIRPRGKDGTVATLEYWPRHLGPMPSFEPEVAPPAPGEEPPAPGEGEDKKDDAPPAGGEAPGH